MTQADELEMDLLYLSMSDEDKDKRGMCAILCAERRRGAGEKEGG